MPAIKTAISLQKELYQEMDRVARKMRVPRSRLFAQAVKEFLERRRADELTENLNRAHGKPQADENRDFRKRANWNLFRRLGAGW